MATNKETTHPDTRQRLLEAAGEMFAEHGYRGANVRDICQKAGANVAAVNYHFGGKERLYSEVLKYWAEIALAKYPPTLGLNGNASPEERLTAFVRSFLFRILDKGRPAWHGKVIGKEMADPTPALDGLVRDLFLPLSERLLGIVRDIAGPEASQEDVRRCAQSIIGQIVFYSQCRHTIPSVFPQQNLEPEDVEALAKHVTRFSLAGIRSFSMEGDAS